MRVLLVSAHPLQDSLTGHLVRLLADRITARGAVVERLDLYAAGFSPVLTAAERRSTYAETYDIRAVAAEVAQLERADLVVLVFPTWWYGLPAMLKGWIDRVWVPGHAYDHASDLGPISGRLTGLRGLLAVTTLGGPAWADWLVMRRPVRRVLRWGVLKVCAPKARFGFAALYRAETVTPARLAAFEAQALRALERLMDQAAAI
ncbi:NAD(P)H-dependent oxidoreductase [Gemmobacter sp. LW-1]|uniref:NAD(P)H-dependent oxidoreductase n=1 Tax=Gemmobacter sp. LW-1 TaxID=1529005 RepID=UPI0006C7610F|nr:NAD(P)H-dependent oxidoreductase [Gemmobacter sp. LW-1]